MATTIASENTAPLTTVLGAHETRCVLEFARLTGDTRLERIAYQALNGYLYQQRKLARYVNALRAANTETTDVCPF